MDANIKKLKKMVAFMKKEGVLSLKSEGIDIQLSPSSLYETKKNQPETKDEPIESKEYTEEEVLFWSSPGIFTEPSEAN